MLTDIGREFIQLPTIVITIVALVALFKFYKSHKDLWAYLVPPVFWLIQVLVFYFCVLLRNHIGLFGEVDYVSWSAILRLCAAVLIAGVSVMLAYEHLIFKR